ncbi:MAG: hypothetical protein EOM26_00355 [Alphaproteobacteria bacterium]|nr:hypothetical protein [Alphaproteobacteria bacterium]
MSSEAKSIAIMQPTFLPWIGYFALMEMVDEFVLLDHVQFDRRSWQQRNRIRTVNGPIWLTVPVSSKGLRDQAIRDVRINMDNPDFPTKMIRTIAQNYKKAPYFHDFSPRLFEVLEDGQQLLANLNLELIRFLAGALAIDTPLLKSSEMQVLGSKADGLVDICRKRGASRYISPPGSKDYLEETDVFQQAGIPVSYFEYEHPCYRQCFDDFEPYMSVIDLLFNEGDNAPAVMRKGVSA